VMPHSSAERYHSFGGICCFHLHHLFKILRQQVTAKHWQRSSKLHGVTLTYLSQELDCIVWCWQWTCRVRKKYVSGRKFQNALHNTTTALQRDFDSTSSIRQVRLWSRNYQKISNTYFALALKSLLKGWHFNGTG
jgi:hypothetical protein